jgi:hypothetical protein
MADLANDRSWCFRCARVGDCQRSRQSNSSLRAASDRSQLPGELLARLGAAGPLPSRSETLRAIWQQVPRSKTIGSSGQRWRRKAPSREGAAVNFAGATSTPSPAQPQTKGFCLRRNAPPPIREERQRLVALGAQTPRPGIEPGPSAWQAEILTTMPSRTWALEESRA